MRTQGGGRSLYVIITAASLAGGTAVLLGFFPWQQFIAAHSKPADESWPALLRPSNGTLPHRRVVIFYHLYVTGNWEEVVDDQTTKLIFSGLYRQAAAIHVGIGAREQQDIDQASKHIQRYGSKFSVVATEVNGTSYERLTLHSIRNNTQPGDRILYLHSKGVVRYDHSPKMRTNVRMWRYVMEYHLIACWRRSLVLLETYDAVGVNWHPPGSHRRNGEHEVYGRHFSGNFWWTTYDHWVSLPEQIGSRYLDPEMFLLQKDETATANVTASFHPLAFATAVIYSA